MTLKDTRGSPVRKIFSLLCVIAFAALLVSSALGHGERGQTLFSSTDVDVPLSYRHLDLLANLSDNPAYLYNFSLSAAFEQKMQFPDGGIDESEDIHYLNTDNTLEAIWIWSRYYTLTRDNQYFDNITQAWNYSIAHPAWLENDSGRVYSCSWAVRAELEFRRAYDDDTYLWYGQTCANYISQRNGWETNIPINDWGRNDIRGLAAGNLYDWAIERGNATLRAKALELGNSTKAAIAANPSWLSMEDWALAGGIAYWGVVRSTFREYPDVAWAEQYGDLLPINVTSPGGGPGNSQCGWFAWYSLGHFAAWEATANVTHLNHFLNMTAWLLLQDGDLDGGIPTNFGDPDDSDESWVTSYRALNLGEILRPWQKIAPDPPEIVATGVTGPGPPSITVAWTLSLQDWFMGDIMRYDVYRGTVYNSSGSGYTVIGSVAARWGFYDDVGAGSAPVNYFYHVVAVDTEWMSSPQSNQGGKLYLPLPAGHGLLSNPFVVEDESPTSILSTISFDYVRTYDSSDTFSPWKSLVVGRPYQSLDVLPLGSAFWVNLTQGGSLVVAGVVPPAVLVQLRAGWNLIGYCSLVPRTVDDALAGIPWTDVELYDPSAHPRHLRRASLTDSLAAGQGIWVNVDSDTLLKFAN